MSFEDNMIDDGFTNEQDYLEHLIDEYFDRVERENSYEDYYSNYQSDDE